MTSSDCAPRSFQSKIPQHRPNSCVIQSWKNMNNQNIASVSVSKDCVISAKTVSLKCPLVSCMDNDGNLNNLEVFFPGETYEHLRFVPKKTSDDLPGAAGCRIFQRLSAHLAAATGRQGPEGPLLGPMASLWHNGALHGDLVFGFLRTFDVNYIIIHILHIWFLLFYIVFQFLCFMIWYVMVLYNLICGPLEPFGFPAPGMLHRSHLPGRLCRLRGRSAGGGEDRWILGTACRNPTASSFLAFFVGQCSNSSQTFGTRAENPAESASVSS